MQTTNSRKYINKYNFAYQLDQQVYAPYFMYCRSQSELLYIQEISKTLIFGVVSRGEVLVLAHFSAPASRIGESMWEMFQFPNIPDEGATLTAVSTYHNCSELALILSHFPPSEYGHQHFHYLRWDLNSSQPSISCTFSGNQKIFVLIPLFSKKHFIIWPPFFGYPSYFFFLMTFCTISSNYCSFFFMIFYA